MSWNTRFNPKKGLFKSISHTGIVKKNPVVKLDPKFGVAPLPFNPNARVIGSPVVKTKAEKKEEKQMKEVYDKVILNGGKKKTAEEKIMDQVINGK